MSNLTQKTVNYHMQLSSVLFYTLESWLPQIIFENMYVTIKYIVNLFTLKEKKGTDVHQYDTFLILIL